MAVQQFLYSWILLAILVLPEALSQMVKAPCPPLPYSTTTAAVSWTGIWRPRCPCIGDFYTRYRFNPRENAPEFSVLWHVQYSYTAEELKTQAITQTWLNYPFYAKVDDLAAAFFDMYWNYLMTQSFGADMARDFSDHNIRDNYRGTVATRVFKLHNAHVGRQLHPEPSLSDVNVVKTALAEGRGMVQSIYFLRDVSVPEYDAEYEVCFPE